MASPRILTLSGSTRPGSVNARLAALAAARLKTMGAAVTHGSLDDYPLPMVSAAGFGNHPAEAMALRELIDSHHGLFITVPEYNAGYPALLKNALDWATVAKPGDPATGLAGKVVALGAASPGAMGGYRALTQFRTVLELGMGALVIPEMVAVGNAGDAFSEDGGIKDARTAGFLDATLQRLVDVAAKLAG
jgi:NAD(P)H-dependent FMN reductase